jgi:hypothetical protein
MYCKRIVVSCLTVALLSVGISESYGQEGLSTKNESYYQPRVAMNYPMLSGNRLSSVNSILGSTITGDGDPGLIEQECGCGLPLLPALAQGLRDTINLIFPCRGRGLLFSERFYGMNCHGCDRVMPGVIYETTPLEVPTPARSFEEIPSTEVPTTSSVLPSVTGFTVANGVRASKVRPVNYTVPSLPNSRGIPSVPYNPLRR